MEIQTSKIEDINEIFGIYINATIIKVEKSVVPWQEFERDLIEREIIENRLWKLTINNQIACIWTISFDDPFIWEERNNEPSMYIHRIATNPSFKGRDLVKEIANWAKIIAKENSKSFIRMDTVGLNYGLVNHYKNCGFDFLGLFKLNNTTDLPVHYRNASVCLFQIALDIL